MKQAEKQISSGRREIARNRRRNDVAGVHVVDHGLYFDLGNQFGGEQEFQAFSFGPVPRRGRLFVLDGPVIPASLVSHIKRLTENSVLGQYPD